jgi:hypothetical protein
MKSREGKGSLLQRSLQIGTSDDIQMGFSTPGMISHLLGHHMDALLVISASAILVAAGKSIWKL